MKAEPKTDWVRISSMWLGRQTQRDADGTKVNVNVWQSQKIGEGKDAFRVQVRGNTYKRGGDDPKIPDGHLLIDKKNLQGLISYLTELKNKNETNRDRQEVAAQKSRDAFTEVENAGKQEMMVAQIQKDAVEKYKKSQEKTKPKAGNGRRKKTTTGTG